MSVEEQVDSLIQHNTATVRKTKKHHGYLFIGIGSFLVTILLLLTIILPAFDPRYDILSFFNEKESSLSPVSDNETDTPAYDYWIAPENSFGASNLKTVNWTHFKQLFNSHTDWLLEYKRYSYSPWTNGGQYLTLSKTWNESMGFWKITLGLDVPVDVYSARFTFACNLSVLQYVNRSGQYEYWINYTANNTETYSVFFNWSDIASIPGIIITHGVLNDNFWFRFRRDNIPAGHYEFDPKFGVQTAFASSAGIYGYIRYFTATNCSFNGRVISFTARQITNTVNKAAKAALYEWISDTNAGSLLCTFAAQTINTGSAWTWITYTANTTYDVVAGTKYILALWGNGSASNSVGYTTGGNGGYVLSTYASSWVSPMVNEVDQDRNYSMYVTYSRFPTENTPLPSNGSVGIHLLCRTNITVDDDDGDSLTITWFNNKTGSWVNYGHNNSVGNGTYRQTASWASSYSTKYWWKCTVNDGTTNVTYWYYFTTEASPSAWRTTQTIGPQRIHNDTAWRTRQTITGKIHNDTAWRTRQTITGLLHNDSVWRTTQTITGRIHNDSVWRTTQTIIGLIHNDSTQQWRTTQTIIGRIHNDSYWRTWQTITGLFHNDTAWRTRQTIIGLIHNDTGWRTRQIIMGRFHNDSNWRLAQTIAGLIHNDSTPGKWHTTSIVSGCIHNDSLAPSGFGGNTRSVVPFLLIGFFGGFMVGMVFYHRGRKKKKTVS